ncbi:MAG: hypothetical protein ABSD75_29130 [Terriglobales bacterium]|jgi:hypothetical protein
MATVVQPFVSRSTVSEDAGGLRISIPPQRSWAILFMLGWLGAWTVGGIAAGTSLFHRFNFFILFWMFAWAFGEVFVGYTVLYTIGGRQIVLANLDALTIKTEIFGIGPARSYLVSEMKNLRFQPMAIVGRGQRSSGIAFDYGAKTVMFGAGLDENEATDLVARIRQRCPVADAASQDSGTKFWAHH